MLNGNQMTNKELIHLITTYPLIEELNEYDSPPGLFLNHIFPKEVSELDSLYLKYCMNAFIPKKRDYKVLLELLEKIANLGSLIRLNIYKKHLKGANIKRIYDVGGGHTGHVDTLKQAFPEAEIYQIDKQIFETFHNLINVDAIQFFRGFTGSSNFLLFMSEFLHCKVDNIEILDYLQVNRCHIIINELHPVTERFIDMRLKKTGGKLISIDDIRDAMHLISPADYRTEYYEAYFDYYLMYIKPLKDRQ